MQWATPTKVNEPLFFRIVLPSAVSSVSPLLRVSGIGSKFSVGHPLAWLGITLLLLFIGYTWLSFYAGQNVDPPDRTAVKKLSRANVNTEILAKDIAAEKQQQMTITRKSDDDRVNEYLQYEAIQQQVLPLLDRADVHFENEQFVSPPGENAWEDYLAILEIDPSESIAKAGLTKVESQLIANAEQAIDAGDYAGAENWLVQLDIIQPGDLLQSELRVEISDRIAAEAALKLQQQEADARQQKIDTALSQAIEEEANLPLNYNKIKDLYDRVIELEPENLRAREGLTRLSDAKLDDVEKLLREGDLDRAESDLALARGIYPGNRRLSSLALALDASMRQRKLDEERKRKQQEELEAQERASKQQQLEAQQDQNAQKKRQEQQAQQNRLVQQSDQSSKTDETGAGGVETLASGVVGAAKAPREPAASAPAPPKPSVSATTLNAGIKAYYNGDYNRSFELLYPLAQEGVPRAQFRIGIMYQFGRSVARNTDLAEKWFTEALPDLLREAQRGIAWAQTDLGTAYEFGISLQQDYERAAYWYKRAANQGYAGAQTNLGVLYAQGDGVPYDRAQAISWFRKAASQGDRVAIENLEVLGVN